MLRRLAVCVFALSTVVGLVGCGGGGSEGTNSGSNAFLFLTGATNSNYDHVWATVTKVDLVSATGSATNVYDSTSTGGKVVDLLSLHNSSGQQYLLLTGFTAPAGSFTGANVTVSSKLSIVPKGSATAVSASFAGSNGASTVLAAKFGTPQSIAAEKDVVVNFNLANWSLNGTTVSAPNNQYVLCGPPNGPFGPITILGGSYYGTVSNLSGSAPNLAFTLGYGPSIQGPQGLSVTTNASTVLSNSDGSANPTLSNGENVAVEGTFDPTTNVLSASLISIQVGTLPPPPASVIGLVTADSLASNSITLTVSGCGGFQPISTSLTVDVTSTTAFVDLSGVTDTETQFFGALTPGTSVVQVQGTISGSTLTAASIQLAPSQGGGNPPTVSVQGPVSNIDAAADTFSLSLAQWTGGWQSPNAVISIVTSANTQYIVNGTTESATTFFGNLTPGSLVNVRGTRASATTSTVTATTITLIPSALPQHVSHA